MGRNRLLERIQASTDSVVCDRKALAYRCRARQVEPITFGLQDLKSCRRRAASSRSTSSPKRLDGRLRGDQPNVGPIRLGPNAEALAKCAMTSSLDTATPTISLSTAPPPAPTHLGPWSPRWMASGRCAVSTVRVSDRDAGGDPRWPRSMRPIHVTECPPAPISPIVASSSIHVRSPLDGGHLTRRGQAVTCQSAARRGRHGGRP
jgi:hypothetical protein